MISISTVVNVSVSAAPAGIAPYSVNNLACLTKETPVVAMGSNKYKVYNNPTDVATDWGSGSATYAAAVAVFSQSPNILSGKGLFIVAPMLTTVTVTPNVTVQEVTIYTQTINGTAFAFTSDATPTDAEVVTGLKALINAGTTGVVASGTTTLILTSAYTFTHSESAKLVAVETSETTSAAITRLSTLVFFGGVSYNYSADQAEVVAAAATAQSLRKLFFVVSSTASDLESGGLLYVIQAATQTQTRGLFHSTAAQAQAFKWAYASRSMSTNFDAPNSTQTMDMKQLSGVLPDDDMSTTTLTACETVGADVYVNIATRSTVRSYGANEFFDNVYNLNWFVATMQVESFNALATTSSKIPQTEEGMNVLKGAVRGVAEKAVANRFVGPGQWNSPDTFGNPEDFRRNIGERGYYIYSAPVASQSQTDRDLRKSQPVMCAIKYQGAIHTADVIIFVNK